MEQAPFTLGNRGTSFEVLQPIANPRGQRDPDCGEPAWSWISVCELPSLKEAKREAREAFGKTGRYIIIEKFQKVVVDSLPLGKRV